MVLRPSSWRSRIFNIDTPGFSAFFEPSRYGASTPIFRCCPSFRSPRTINLPSDLSRLPDRFRPNLGSSRLIRQWSITCLKQSAMSLEILNYGRLEGCKIFVIHQVRPAWIAESRSGAVNVILGGTSVGQPYAYTMQLAKDSGAFRHPCTAVLRTFFAFASFFSMFSRKIYLCTLCDISIARTLVALPDHESARN